MNKLMLRCCRLPFSFVVFSTLSLFFVRILLGRVSITCQFDKLFVAEVINCVLFYVNGAHFDAWWRGCDRERT